LTHVDDGLLRAYYSGVTRRCVDKRQANNHTADVDNRRAMVRLWVWGGGESFR